MRNIAFATVAAFGLAVSVSAFAMASNDRIMTDSTALPHGLTLADGRTVADSAGGGEGRIVWDRRAIDGEARSRQGLEPGAQRRIVDEGAEARAVHLE